MLVDAALQRKNMVESQVRPSDVTDRRIIRAMAETPREIFVPADRQTVAYMDETVPLAPIGTAARRWLMAPRTLALLVQLLDLGAQDVVLDIGGGSGYSAAVLARIAQTVVALESDAEVIKAAGAALAAAGADNVAVVEGPLAAGFGSEGPYDAILFSGGVADVPAVVLDQMKDGGRLVAVVVAGGVGRATQWKRVGGHFDRRPHFEAWVPLLPEFTPRPGFVF